MNGINKTFNEWAFNNIIMKLKILAVAWQTILLRTTYCDYQSQFSIKPHVMKSYVVVAV